MLFCAVLRVTRNLIYNNSPKNGQVFSYTDGLYQKQWKLCKHKELGMHWQIIIY